jgi:hypothetical protein
MYIHSITTSPIAKSFGKSSRNNYETLRPTDADLCDVHPITANVPFVGGDLSRDSHQLHLIGELVFYQH